MLYDISYQKKEIVWPDHNILPPDKDDSGAKEYGSVTETTVTVVMKDNEEAGTQVAIKSPAERPGR